MRLCQTLLRLYTSFMVLSVGGAGDMSDYLIGFLVDVRSLFNVRRIFVEVSLLHKSVLYFVSLKRFATPDCRLYFLMCPIILYSLGFVTFILAEVTFHHRLVKSFILNYFYCS
jgi:hypothetical protein